MRKRLAIPLTVLGLLAIVAGIISPVASSSASPTQIVRWDLVQFASSIVVAGGEDVSVDAATGDTITLTGSGHAVPSTDRAFGGGTFVHKHSDGTEVAHGGFYVTGLRRWRPLAGGSLPTGIKDGIGPIHRASSGVLRLDIKLVPEVGGAPGTPIQAILSIFCDLPGTVTPVSSEGVRVRVPNAFFFTQDPDQHGFTLFHILGK